MASASLQILGIILTLLGWMNALVIVVAQVVWEGLWMSCVVQNTGQMQCKVYNSLLRCPRPCPRLPPTPHVVALLLALLGLLVYLTGAKCTTCVEDKDSKAPLVLVSGIIFVISGSLLLLGLGSLWPFVAGWGGFCAAPAPLGGPGAQAQHSTSAAHATSQSTPEYPTKNYV
ncbi:unnamed protein product [Nyctereutes procyonoides]|uniref:Claudin n=1 Tax=Nyctereutes procyonoides TaxID=34880 RepID=A0A811YT15_NYCPR|nr:unnamed protein product [Nyctereutes procyonoides]